MAILISSNASFMPAWNFFSIDEAEGDCCESACTRTIASLYMGDLTYRIQVLDYPINTDWRVSIRNENSGETDVLKHFKTLGQCISFVEEKCSALERVEK